MYKKLLSVLAFSVSLLLSQAMFADCGRGLKDIVASIKMDEAQKEKIKPILEEWKASMKDRWSSMKEIHDKLKEQVQSDQYDQAAVDSLVDQKTKVIGDAMKAKIAAKHKIYMALTPEQRSKFKEAMAKVEEKMAAKFKKCDEE